LDFLDTPPVSPARWLAHQAGLLETGQREVEKAVSTAGFSETIAEIGQHAEWLAGCSVGRGDGVVRAEQVLDGEGSFLVGGRDLHRGQAGYRHVCVIDRPHARHDVLATEKVLLPGHLSWDVPHKAAVSRV